MAKPATKGRSATKYVYSFGGGKAEGDGSQKNLLGGKGANLAEMSRIGLPVPPGFTCTTEVCTYFYANNTIYRAVVDPTLTNYPTVWNPIQPSWWTQPGFVTNVATNANAEAMLTGVYPYDASWNNGNPFSYAFRGTNTNSAPSNPPSGLTIGFSVASRQATRSGRDAVNTNDRKQMKYDIELNIPPPFNP